MVYGWKKDFGKTFLGPEKCKIGKNQQKMAISELLGAKKSQKLKYTKSGR